MTRWDVTDPGAGVMMGPMGYAATLRTQAETIEQVWTGTDTVLGSLGDEVWSGAAADAYRSSLRVTRSHQRTVTNAIEPVQVALDAYASAVVGIQQRAAHQQQVRDDARRRQYQLGGWDPGAGPAMVQHKQQLAEQAEVDAYYAERALEDLAAERQSADDALVAALAVPGGAAWERRKQVLAHAGITGVDALDRDKLVEAYVRFADQALDGDLDEGDVTYLRDFFDAWGDDPGVMDAYFRSLGAARTRELVDEIGLAMTDPRHPIDPAELAIAAAALRSGLSTASRDWDDEQAEAFTADLLDGVSSAGGGDLSTIGWLFGDPAGAPMGPAFTVATADLLDGWERSPDRVGFGPVTDRSPFSGGRNLTWFENLDAEGFARSDDPMGRVFETLGTYPDEALTWLTSDATDVGGSGTAGEARVEYWYGERDWGVETTGDGFAGPAALWAGSQRVAGGPADTAYDEATWNRVEGLTGRIMNELGENESFSADALSPQGAENVAKALAIQLPMLTEYSIVRQGQEFDGGFDTDVLPWDDSERAVPAVTMETLAKIAGAAGHHESGAGVLTEAVDRYQNDLIALAALDPTAEIQDGVSVTDGNGLFARITGLQGLVDGATAGTDVRVGAERDAEIQAVIDGARSVIDEIPIPGASKLASGVLGASLEWGVDKLQDEAISAGKDYLESKAIDRWGGNEERISAAADGVLVDRRGEIEAEAAEIIALLDPDKYSTAQGALEAFESESSRYKYVYDSARAVTEEG
ncbi:hypothetical protein CLV28_1433 [Sediminihabitans luteus]|uniref:Uncharacterized protein n=1 Tax=Sediminihabitans luteus TaxID=1138585 RepID=A0A2M9CPV8_9CELL|nr:DUF6571 family protein [Sediminihabitans luteus]PJJ73949.1 hypothetical protein CLV28_1433 [Sediminihabitans luteus]GII98138.1 hypothetical protein Slu03_05160 [Sediminihabitans luteus]